MSTTKYWKAGARSVTAAFRMLFQLMVWGHFMHTLSMSRTFRLLVLIVAALWALAPQIACFMPDQMTQFEQEYCRQMGGVSAGSGVSHEYANAYHAARLLPRVEWPV